MDNAQNSDSYADIPSSQTIALANLSHAVAFSSVETEPVIRAVNCAKRSAPLPVLAVVGIRPFY
jgi:hypothetical protein